MKPISALLYECTTEEARSLPKGFQVLEYDTLYGSLRLLTAGENKIRNDKRYVYLLHKFGKRQLAPNVRNPPRSCRRKRGERMRKNYDGMSVTLGAPDVTITAEQFREYRELQEGKDRTILSLQAQIKLQQSEWGKAAIALAKAVDGAFIGSSSLGVAIANQPSAQKAYELAREILEN